MDFNVTVNDFVLRQTKESGKTYTDLEFSGLAKYASNQLKIGNYRRGYRDGVILVPVENDMVHHFYCPFVKIDSSTKLIARFVKRRPEEKSYIQIRAESGNICTTGKVDLILYHNNVLKESDEHTEGSEWELISFHAIPIGVNEMPMGPVTMMRNQLELVGGTKGTYSSDEWAESVKFWQKYAILEPKNRGK